MSKPARSAPGWLIPPLDPLVRWAVAAALFLAFLTVRLELPATGFSYPFLIFFPAVLLAAWIAGRGPALAVAVASGAAAWWFLIRTPGIVTWPLPADAAAVVLFLCISAFAAALVSGLAGAASAAARARADAEAALAAQQMLGSELQHRVANNLQLVASALTQQARDIGGTPAAAALGEATRRLDALARLHRRLIAIEQAPGGGGILDELCRTQIEASGNGRLALEVEVDPAVRLDAERLTALGMIASEALSNALKHGFPDRRSGRLHVRLRAVAADRAELEVRDSGVGLPEGFDVQHTDSLGLRIVQSLTQRLGGTLSLSSDRGTILRVTFPTEAASPRA